MIVKRKYLTLGELFNDSETKKVLEEAWTVFDGVEHPERWDFLKGSRIIDKDMSWAIPNPEKFFTTIENGFEKLDKTHPYNTNYNLESVNKVEFIDYNVLGFFKVIRDRDYNESVDILVTAIEIDEENNRLVVKN